MVAIFNALLVIANFLIVGIAISITTFCRMTWLSVNGLVISCVQYDKTVKQYKSPGQRLYFERITTEVISYAFKVDGQIYSGVYEESLKAGEKWVAGQRRELISEMSKTPVSVWYNPKRPCENSIKKTRLTDLPLWPWLFAFISLCGAVQQLQDRKNTMRINKEFPETIHKAQIEALRRKLEKRTIK